MKKLIVAVVIVLLLAVAPWGIGILAEKRVNSGLDQLIETAPYLTIVDRKFNRGWFTSEQEVTFEAFGPWMRAMNSRKVMDEISKVPSPQSGQSSQDLPISPPREGAAAGAPDAADAPAAPAAAASNPLKFTVHNHIVHGPVLWFTGVGVARVDSSIVLPDDARAELTKLFGDQPPVEVSTRVRFFGGGTTTISGAAQDVKVDGKNTSLAYDAFKFKVGYSGHLDDVEFDGNWPRLEFKDSAKGESALMKDLSVDGTSHRMGGGDLYGGKFKVSIDQTQIVGADQELTEIAGLHYGGATSSDDDFMDIALQMGSGAVKSKALDQLGVALKEVHYDFTLRRLHLETMQKMVTAMKAAYGRPLTSAADVDAAMMKPMKEFGLELLKHDPELRLDRIGVSTPDGDAYVKGIVKLIGVTEQDLDAGGAAMAGKIDADITVEIAQKLAEKIPNGATAVGGAIDQGYARRDGDRIVSHIEFRKGVLKINGKEQGIPGLGGPPQPPPPQE
jgi:uncharacterized protein YdgA (DUF945 family)